MREANQGASPKLDTLRATVLANEQAKLLGARLRRNISPISDLVEQYDAAKGSDRQFIKPLSAFRDYNINIRERCMYSFTAPNL